MKNKQKITDLPEEAFLSFLYSERERENSLSEFHGWNNWALAGAIVTVVYSGYALLKYNSTPNVCGVVYYTCCLVAFFLAYHSWANIFRRDRGVDFSKVRLLKEVIPVVKLVFVYACSITSAILVAVLDGLNLIFWLWVVLLLIYSVAIAFALCLKGKIVPPYFRDMLLPWAWANVAFEAMVGAIYGIIGTHSYKLAGGQVLSTDFELAASASVFLVLLYILFKLNFSNKVVRRFDEIMDNYLYGRISKEDTFHEILKNRMGYGVIDVCQIELKAVEKQTQLCVEEEQELLEMREYVNNGAWKMKTLQGYQNRVDVILSDQQTALNLTKALVERMNETAKVSTTFMDIDEMNNVFDTNQRCHEKVKTVSEIAGEVSRLLHESEKKILMDVNAALVKVLDGKEVELKAIKKNLKNEG